MSETYTVEGKSFFRLNVGDNACQSFIPLEDHDLHYIDLNIRPLPNPAFIAVSVYFATNEGIPFGPRLSSGEIYQWGKTPRYGIYRVRFFMTPRKLLTETRYCITVFIIKTDTLSAPELEYDKDDATYPRGHRSHSTDFGETWTSYPNDDLIFTEFGTPPLPKPEPPPPIENFAILDLAYLQRMDGIVFSLPTSVPCHLTCYWTDKKPQKHHTSRTIRGELVPWGTYFCFVAWHAVEQNEEGDTLYHTFDLIPWETCQTRWFTFRGNVDDTLSPSVGPIFEKHNRGLIQKAFITRTTDGSIDSPASRNYLIAHNAPLGYAYSTQPTWYLGQNIDIQDYYHIYRAGLFFDTSTLPDDAELHSATLTYSVKSKYGIGFNIVIVNGEDLSEPLQNHHYGDLLNDITSLGSAPPVEAWNLQHIPLNALGLAKINKQGLTKLALRTSQDINSIPPPFWNYQEAHAAETTLKPYLTITYLGPKK